ncbi:DNA-binding transcriptional regulator, LysR family [Formivibrio citricus]|uniref:DNA-binding transcriptional regulator, LysR family n=1 Tax=Formivibrio citricus TaxID=83765 RepID=A0A1I5AF77_9NEIS|nr:LysR family transcriptional regulator [Formivibrio citricus]SFN60859.1 DNA-binding transcriptional regulator, LysR family [Formivibrio citricus]
MLKITFRELEVFAAIHRTGGITTAGVELGLSQSATSSAIAELERRLGVNLFDRVGRRVLLNEHGRYFLPKALDILRQAGDLELIYANGAPSRLKIAASLTIGNYILPTLLARLRIENPAARYEATIGNSQSVVASLLECRADIGLIESSLVDSHLASELWLRDEMVIYCRADHPFTRKTPSYHELASAPWILREKGSGVRQSLETMLLPALGSFNVNLELGSGEAIREAVRQGAGIACASRRAVQRELESGEFATITLGNVNLERRFFIAWHAEKSLTTGAEQFRAACREWKKREESMRGS